MNIGHINLDKSMNGIGEHFVKLVESLDRQGLNQHVIVSNTSLARRLEVCENVRVGPVVSSSVMAYCLMPDVDVAHVHDGRSNQAGLVLRLTRSIPYVLTRRETSAPSGNPLSRSKIARAAGIVCPTQAAADAITSAGFDVPLDVIADISYDSCADEIAENRVAAEHQRIYRRALDTRRIPALLL